jgi:hypothetical protein
MNITRRSAITGIVRVIDLPITEAQEQAYNQGELLQNAFPNLTPEQREFYKTGTTDEEWQSFQ